MKNSHKYALLLALFILSLSLFYLPESFAQQGEATPEVANVPASQNTMPITVHVQTPTEAPQYISDAIGILQTSASLMGVVIGAIGIIIVLLGVFGFFELREWRRKREEFQKQIDEAGKMAEEAEKQAEDATKKIKEIEEARKKAVAGAEQINKIKNDVEKLGTETPTPPITEKPSEELKKKYDEIAKKVEALETLGTSLSTTDYFKRGVNFYYKENYESALAAFDKAIELSPNFIEAWHFKAQTLIELETYEDALKAYVKAIELNPNNADAWINKGFALEKLEKYEDALKAVDKAIELNPDSAIAWDNKGYSLIKSNRLEKALNAINKAIELKSDYASAWFNLAIYHIAKHDKENALINLKKAIELDDTLKDNAKKDKDFKDLWDDPDFKKITK